MSNSYWTETLKYILRRGTWSLDRKNNLSQVTQIESQTQFSFTLNPLICTSMISLLLFHSLNQYLLRLYYVLDCSLRAGAVVIDTRETIFAMLLSIYPTAWWKLPLDNPPQTYQFSKQPFPRLFSPSSTLILHLTGLQIKVFLHIVQEVFLREGFQGEHCTHGVTKTSTAGDGWPRI